jgi:predicted RNase H-like HicB family nuclease
VVRDLKVSDKYHIEVYWSDEDDTFLAISPEFPGFSVLGDSREEVLLEAENVLEVIIETYEIKGLPISSDHTK